MHVLLIACLTLFLSNHDSFVTSAPAPLTFEQFKKNYVSNLLKQLYLIKVSDFLLCRCLVVNKTSDFLHNSFFKYKVL